MKPNTEILMSLKRLGEYCVTMIERVGREDALLEDGVVGVDILMRNERARVFRVYSRVLRSRVLSIFPFVIPDHVDAFSDCTREATSRARGELLSSLYERFPFLSCFHLLVK